MLVTRRIVVAPVSVSYLVRYRLCNVPPVVREPGRREFGVARPGAFSARWFPGARNELRIGFLSDKSRISTPSNVARAPSARGKGQNPVGSLYSSAPQRGPLLALHRSGPDVEFSHFPAQAHSKLTARRRRARATQSRRVLVNSSRCRSRTNSARSGRGPCSKLRTGSKSLAVRVHPAFFRERHRSRHSSRADGSGSGKTRRLARSSPKDAEGNSRAWQSCPGYASNRDGGFTRPTPERRASSAHSHVLRPCRLDGTFDSA
jgi:hypothetical protein